MKKWYFASRVRHQEIIKKITRYLEQNNQEVLSDWVFQFIKKPFYEHLDENQKMAVNVLNSILQSDVFVLVSDLEGTDMFVELGIALANKKLNPETRIYIIGEHNKRSLMQIHPFVIHVDSLDEVFEKENINISDIPFDIIV